MRKILRWMVLRLGPALHVASRVAVLIRLGNFASGQFGAETFKIMNGIVSFKLVRFQYNSSVISTSS